MKLDKSLHYDEALELFNSISVATQVARELCEKYGIDYDETEGRKVRRWLNPDKHISLRQGDYIPKVLIYDIETSLAVFYGWWTGKQYVKHQQILEDPKIISIAYKWLGEEDVYFLSWDSKKNDETMIKKFLDVYNSADMVIGVNNDNFDNRWLNAQAATYGLDVDVNIKSFDLQKKAKSKFRLPSYSMEYMAKRFGLGYKKLKHRGIDIWKEIQFGTKDEAANALQEMLDYNVRDILVTEALYNHLRRYMSSPTHLGVVAGHTKCTCPECGGTDLELYKTVVTAAGTIQRLMRCKHDGVVFKISNRDYYKITA